MIVAQRALAAAGVAAALVGCAQLPPAEPSVGLRDVPEAPAAQPQPDAGAGYRVEIDAPAELGKLLETYLDIERFRGAASAEQFSAAELDRLIAAAPAQARSLLETEGYFSPQVSVRRDAADASLVRVTVEPGPRARIGDVTIEVQGDLQSDATAGDQDAIETIESLRRSWRLPAGEAFRQAAWSDAKNALLARLRAAGYATATWSGTTARVDTESDRVRLFVVAESGPLFRTGELRIEGLQYFDERAVRRLADFEPGAPATEQRLLDFQERLLTAGLFESAVVEFTPDAAQAAAVPINVRLREQPRHTLTTGVGISANTGPRVLLEHTGRKLFGLYATVVNKFEIGRDRRAWTGEIVSHPLPDQYRNLLAGDFERLESTGEVRTTWSARVGRRLEGVRISRLYYGEVLSSELVNAAGQQRGVATWANYQWNWRDVDSVILPTRGVTLTAQSGGGWTHNDVLDDGPFGRAWGRLTGYLPMGETWHAEARLELGQVFARDNVGLPDPLLFRAGGDGSVRGYDYRSLGPVVDGVITSGRAIMTTSVEVARPFTTKLPTLWGAAFIDAGQAADNFKSLDPVVGYGVGVRYRSPVGPLRVDIAYGQEVKRWRLHLSVGIAL